MGSARTNIRCSSIGFDQAHICRFSLMVVLKVCLDRNCLIVYYSTLLLRAINVKPLGQNCKKQFKHRSKYPIQPQKTIEPNILIGFLPCQNKEILIVILINKMCLSCVSNLFQHQPIENPGFTKMNC